MINYKNTILYKIYNNINGDIYYGITANKTTSHLLAYYKNYFMKYKKQNIKNENLKLLCDMF